MEFIQSQKVDQLLDGYPKIATHKLRELRSLIIQTAEELGVNKLMETTKWNEPSYVTKKGSTIRMDWKEKTPDKFYLFFICSTELVNTFKLMVGDELLFEGNRAIVLDINEPVPAAILKRCIALALKYHEVKHLPMLGV